LRDGVLTKEWIGTLIGESTDNAAVIGAGKENLANSLRIGWNEGITKEVEGGISAADIQKIKAKGDDTKVSETVYVEKNANTKTIDVVVNDKGQKLDIQGLDKLDVAGETWETKLSHLAADDREKIRKILSSIPDDTHKAFLGKIFWVSTLTDHQISSFKSWDKPSVPATPTSHDNNQR
jgi:hypothetical protein